MDINDISTMLAHGMIATNSMQQQHEQIRLMDEGEFSKRNAQNISRTFPKIISRNGKGGSLECVRAIRTKKRLIVYV